MSKVAMVFPGQGSQYIGMLHELAEHYPIVSTTFSSVSDVLGYDLWQLVQNGPEETLNQTQYTQAAMLTADVAVYNALISLGKVNVAIMAGHSLGEYAALVCAGAMTLPQAAKLVTRRGQLMQDAVPLGHGSMAVVVGLTDNQVADICKQASTDNLFVMPANYNAPGQVVIAGHTEAVEQAIVLAQEQKALMARVIPVSAPCHTLLLKQAAEEFAADLQAATITVPYIPVINNVDLRTYESVEQIKMLLEMQLYSPVEWVKTIESMQAQGIKKIIECGPGRVLTGLVKRINKQLQVMSVNDSSSLTQAITLLGETDE